MYCRTCGKLTNERAVACTGCGVPPLGGREFCNNCGVATRANQVLCVKCGVSLPDARTLQSTQAIVSDHPRPSIVGIIVGVILIVVGLEFVFGMTSFDPIRNIMLRMDMEVGGEIEYYVNLTVAILFIVLGVLSFVQSFFSRSRNAAYVVRICKGCGTKYKPSDYNPDAAEWLCSVCKQPLARE